MGDTVSGIVVRQHYSPGSKSDRDAVMIEMQNGTRLLLVRRDANPFVDPVVDALVGHRIEARGEKTDVSFILDRWTVRD